MLYSVQFLRAVAAVLVVVCHAVTKQGQISGTGAVWEIGGSGVDLFFIISGFIMCHVTANRKVTVRGFLVARVLRIIPLYWALTLVALMVYIVSPSLVNSSGGTTTVLHSFTLIPTGAKFLIQNGWTLTYEFWFYVIFAATLCFALRWRLAIVSGIMVALAVGGSVLQPANPTVKFLTAPIVLEFVMGIGAYLFVRYGSRSRELSALLVFIGVVSLFSYALSGEVHDRVYSYGVPMAFVFAGLVSAEDTVRRVSDTMLGRVAGTIGDASYSLYLSHPFALATTAFAIKRFGLQEYPITSIAVLTALALVGGYLCYALIEVNLIKLVKLASEKSMSGVRADGKRVAQR
ncbi:acyltransferase [Cupriavidus sp. AcVe19-1a]|uniref:acyltransferase family protein n=1 Tax=Cupriavidus sp. AcVe19-1a TaxID=2821359 RepID=UPI001AE825D8|nr:acyltransferase [Cupriavidus sp. AcVe19-1a]MBP0630565.1 acyltransferase [Cupriavidus sp. AcVe19-1a]